MSHAADDSDSPTPPQANRDMLQVLRGRVDQLQNPNNDPKLTISPGTWLSIFTAVTQVLTACMASGVPLATVAQSVKAPTLLQQVSLHGKLISQLGGRSNYRKVGGDNIHAALVAAAQGANASDVTALLTQLSAK